MSLFERNLYVIAEVANAPQGNVETCHRIIDEVAKTGADGIKFQFYKYDELVTPSYRKYETFRRVFFTKEERTGFIRRAREAGLDVLVDVFDRWGLQVTRANLDEIEAVKIPPTVILDDELVQQIFDLGKPTIIGVGGYEDEEIDFVLSKVKGRTNPILLMHGFQGFPTKEEDTCLKRVAYLKKKYGYPIGFADHVDGGSELALRLPEYAFFAGATVIEKHVTLDRAAKGLDYWSALEPGQFARMVSNLKRCITIYGAEHITSAQKEYLKDATRITTARKIKAGELIFKKDIKFRRTEEDKALFPNEVDDYFPAIALCDLELDAGVIKRDIRKATIGTIVGCRMHSKRLPQKALVKIAGVPSVERCLLNTLASSRSEKTILATSTHPDDAVLESHTLNGRVHFFRGSENDLVARFIDAAEEFDIDIIVRVTGDSVLISYELIDLLIDTHVKAGADFSYLKDAPLGTKPEIINKYALIRLKSLISTDEHSEYLSSYFKNNPDFFNLNEIVPPEIYQCPEYRLVLDCPEDLELLNTVFEQLGVGKEEPVALRPVLKLLKRRPEIAAINSSIKPKYTQGEFAEFLNKITRISTDKSDSAIS